MIMKVTNKRKIGRTLLCALLCVLMVSSMLTFALAEGEEDGLTAGGAKTEQPVLVITGQGALGGAEYTADNIANEKAYTMEELQALDLTLENLYSAINSQAFKRFYRGRGIDIAGLLELLGYEDADVISAVASDGFSARLDLSDDRYYYPNFANASEEGAELVKAILAWVSADNRDDPPVLPPPFGDDAKAGAIRLLAGQLAVDDVNMSLFTNNVSKLQLGEAITEVALTALGKALTRADVLLLPRTEHTHTRTNSDGETVETELRGVMLEALLEDVADDAEIAFATVDKWDRISEYTMTKAKLVERNAILAYEFKDGDDWATYFRSTSAGPGYLRLWVDDFQAQGGAHAVNVVRVIPKFDDLADFEWASEAINGLARAGLISGKEEGKFAPGDPLTRAMIVTILGRVMGADLPTVADGRFPDVDYGDYYGSSVQWATEEGIVQGYTDGTFRPNDNIVEEHLALLMSNVGLTELPDCVDPGASGNANRAQMAVAMWALLQELS